jgi:hypothetical protein
MKISQLKPGMTVYDCHKYKMGNTSLSTYGVWLVHVVSVDENNGTIEASWNCNGVNRYRESEWKKWKLEKPVMITGMLSRKRPATKKEAEAIARGEKVEY